MEKGMLVLILVLVFSKAGASLSIKLDQTFYLSELADDGSGDVSDDGLCLTEECVSTACNLLESIDNSTDPCEDFYQFACGGWIQRQILPPHRMSKMTLYNQDQHLAVARNLVAEKPKPDDLDAVKKAKILYASCIKHTSGDKDYWSIANLVKRTFGAWPITSKDYNEEVFNRQRFLSEAIKLGVHPLFLLEVNLHYRVDEDDGKIIIYRVLQIDKPSLGLPITVYGRLFKNDLNRQIYATRIYDDAKIFAIKASEISKEDALEIVEVERTLANDLNIPLVLYPENWVTVTVPLLTIGLAFAVTMKILGVMFFLLFMDYVSYKRNVQYSGPFTNLWLEVIHIYEFLLYMELADSSLSSNYTLGMMDESFGELLNWTDFVSTLGASPDIGVTDINPDQEVILNVPAYLQNMTEYFTQLPARTQANYIVYRVVDSLLNVLVKEHTKMETIMKRTVFGVSADPSPEEACVSYVSGAFKLVIHRLLYADQLPPQEIKAVTALMEEIRQQFDKLVNEHSWVDKETLRLIKEKNAAIAVTLVNFEKAMNDTLLDIYYANVTVNEGIFLNNVVQQRREAFARNLRSLVKPYERTVDNLPHELVAQNFLLTNELEFTSVLFEPPLFINNVPMSVNYAGTGQIFGHEIVHAFDNTGIKFSKEGIPGQWWNNETLQVFQERAQCLVDQYSKFYDEQARGHVRGELTLGENIADNAGIKLAYRAYKKHVSARNQEELRFPGVPYTDEQVFFVKFAQNWCTVDTVEAARWQLMDDHSPNQFRPLSLHTDNSISAPVSSHRSHQENLSTVHEFRGTSEDPIVCILELHKHDKCYSYGFKKFVAYPLL